MRRIATILQRAKAGLPTLHAVVRETLRGFRADRGIDLAASLAFTTLLTAVPLLATFSFLVATVFEENDARIVEIINTILPYHTDQLTASLLEFIAESTALSGVGLILLIVASVRLIFIVEEVFNAVWGAPRRRAWFARIGLYLLVLVILALVLGVIGLILPSLTRFTGFPLGQSAFALIVDFLALTLLYRCLPNAYVHWSSAGLSGIVIALLLELLRGVFKFYVDALSRTNLITGSLALAFLALFSVYLVWVLILLGVELTHVLQTKARRGSGIGETAGRAENAIRMLLHIASGNGQRYRDLYLKQEASSVEAEKILDCLRENGLIRGTTARGFTLAERPQEITVARVVEAVSPNLYGITPDESDRVVQVLTPLFKRLDAERRAVLGTTLADLRES